jgi:hypothetical protein
MRQSAINEMRKGKKGKKVNKPMADNREGG